MTVKELIEQLQQYPKDLKVWVSDGGYCEGATPLKNLNKVIAWEADLDGDDVDDEYEYITKEDVPNYADSHKIIHLNEEFVASKYIILIHA